MSVPEIQEAGGGVQDMHAALTHIASEIEGQLKGGTLAHGRCLQATRIYWGQLAGVARASLAGSGLRQRLFERICTELDHAYAKHGDQPWGRHEFYAILLEEVDELWDAIKADADPGDVAAELVQVAAMCFRYYETGGRIGRVHP